MNREAKKHFALLIALLAIAMLGEYLSATI